MKIKGVKRLINTNKCFSLHADTMLYILYQIFEQNTLPSTVDIALENIRSKYESDFIKYTMPTDHFENLVPRHVLQ